MEKHLQAVERLPIRVVLNAEVTEFIGDIHLKQAVIYDNQTLDKSILDVDEAVIQVGFAPNLDMLRRWGVKVENDRRIKVTADMRTSVPGIFACGDIVTYPGKDMRVVTGAGEAVTAVLSAYKFLKKPYWA
jgi:thioredoxin reductase (NADPH)